MALKTTSSPMMLKLNSALYAGQVEVPLLKRIPDSPVTMVGQKGPLQTGLCASHPRNAPEPYNAKVSAAAFFLDAVDNGRISCAAGEGNVYGELRYNSRLYRFYCDGNIIRQEATLPEHYRCVPVILHTVIHHPDLGTYFDAFQSNPSVEHILQFCDSFWYDYAKARDSMVIEMELDTNQIQAAYQFGKLNTITEINTSACELFNGLSQKVAKMKTRPRPDVFADFMKEPHKVDYEWEDSQKSRIRSVESLDDFVPTESFYKVMKKIDFRVRQNMVDNLSLGITDINSIKQDYVNILLWGDPGTGKTTLANAVSAVTGMPLYVATINEDSEDDEFEGKNKIVNGSISFVETAFLEAFQKGGIILLEEINLARANVFTSVINQAVEYPFLLKRNGYDQITRNPLTVIIATMNLDTEGTSAVNSSSSQRFLSKYEITEPTEEEFKNVLVKKGFLEKDVRYVYRVYSKVRNELRSSETKRRYLKELSIRQCLGALMSMQEGIDAKEALTDSIYGSLAVKNKKVADGIRISCLENMVNYATFS